MKSSESLPSSSQQSSERDEQVNQTQCSAADADEGAQKRREEEAGKPGEGSQKRCCWNWDFRARGN